MSNCHRFSDTRNTLFFICDIVPLFMVINQMFCEFMEKFSRLVLIALGRFCEEMGGKSDLLLQVVCERFTKHSYNFGSSNDLCSYLKKRDRGQDIRILNFANNSQKNKAPTRHKAHYGILVVIYWQACAVTVSKLPRLSGISWLHPIRL